MGDIVTLAKYANNRGMTDIQAVNAANVKGVQIHSLREFNRRLLETDTWKGEKELYPALSSKWVISEAKDKKIDKSGIIERTYDDGIRRLADLNALGLSQYIGKKNIAFFVDQNPNLGNGKPNLEIVEDGKNAIVVVNDLKTIVAIENMPRHGEKLSPYNYERLIGVAPTDTTYLQIYISDNSNNRLLACDFDDASVFISGDVTVGGFFRFDLFGVQGEQTGAQAPAAAPTKSIIVVLDGKATQR